MSGDPSIKIRTIPRPNEKSAPAAAATSAAAKVDRQKVLIAVMSAAIVALSLAAYWKSSKARSVRAAKAAPKAAPVVRQEASVRPDSQDTRVAEAMMRRRIELENQRTMGARGADEGGFYLSDPAEEGRILGVQMDQENTAERIYEDLYGEKNGFAEGTPEERISARLANRKWANEEERAARLHFVKNFIRQAYDRGFEVELDQNLVVVGVKRLGTKKVNIDEVLNRLAKQGH